MLVFVKMNESDFKGFLLNKYSFEKKNLQMKFLLFLMNIRK